MRWGTGLRRAGIAAAVLLAAFWYRSAAKSSALVNERADIVMIRLGGQNLDIAGAQELQEQELSAEQPLELNFWGEAGETLAESRENGQRAAVSLLYTGEKTGLIIPGTEVLSWKEDGCFLDRKTAAALFGSERAAGQAIWCGERRYTVCGTFESFRNIMLCRARREDGAVLTAISCRVPRMSGAASCVEEFLMRRNLAGEFADFTFLAYLSHDLLLLPPVCLGIRLLQMISGAIACGGRARAGQPVEEKGSFLPLLRCLRMLLTAGILLFLWKNVRIPADMIPSRWSDFSFWGTWWEEQRKNLLFLLHAAQGEAQVNLLWNFCRFVCADAAAAVCLLLCVN